jgi:hypothetical protein
MAKKRQQVPRRIEQAIAALLDNATIAEAAEQLKVSERTLRGWMDRDDFKKAFSAARRAVVDASLLRMQQLTKKALLAFNRNVECGVPSVEVSAARGVWDIALRGIEVDDLASQVEELRGQVEAIQKGRATHAIADPEEGGGAAEDGAPPAGTPDPGDPGAGEAPPGGPQ